MRLTAQQLLSSDTFEQRSCLRQHFYLGSNTIPSNYLIAIFDPTIFVLQISTMSLAKLTAVSTKTLSLLLERQRLQTLPSSTSGLSNGSSLHYPQIKRNLKQLREGILALETKEGSTSEAAKLLRSQYDRMRGMLWEEERAEIPRFASDQNPGMMIRFINYYLYFP